MARLPRYKIPNYAQHVIVRGNNREPIFIADTDYYYYLEILKNACKKHDCDLHAYVLMKNHVHLLLTPRTEESLSKMMQMIGRYYVQHFNFIYKRTGTLWEGRYKATVVDSEYYLLTCYRYIELNPVRSNTSLVDPADYPWSSYNFNAFGNGSAMITPHEKYLQLGQSADERQQAYRQLFDHQMSNKMMTEIAQSTNKAWIMGSRKFKDKIEQQLARRTEPTAKGGDRRSIEYREKIKSNHANLVSL